MPGMLCEADANTMRCWSTMCGTIVVLCGAVRCGAMLGDANALQVLCDADVVQHCAVTDRWNDRWNER